MFWAGFKLGCDRLENRGKDGEEVLGGEGKNVALGRHAMMHGRWVRGVVVRGADEQDGHSKSASDPGQILPVGRREWSAKRGQPGMFQDAPVRSTQIMYSAHINIRIQYPT